ncbi:MAG: nitric oxide-sensing protein NosP [Sulfuritalea sp.]|nr:nitric oxide-sensing protein NosP [Sulfuritalea sp.]MDP1982423.1 nitric oxide-sensing protein NosP [Sulfuritalea sp.]
MNSERRPSRILRAQSRASDAREAVREFHAAVAQPDMALVIFFCSSEYDLDQLADEMKLLFAGVQVVGCTTAGEIGPAGYLEHSLTGASFPAGSFTAVSGRIERLHQFKIADGQAFAQNLLQSLESRAPQADADNSFALLLIDGLSVREEPATRALQSALGRLPLFGGSAGDGLDFGQTQVYFEGGFHTDSAILVLVSTPLPFRLFKIQHFLPTEQRLVVTAADAGHRIVSEIDGWPAAEAYARLVGTDVRNLDPLRFAASPVVVLIDGTNYVRSIQKANQDGSLTFFCAIEEGVVLRVARGIDLVENLEQALVGIRAAIGPPQLVLGCDCILRRLEIVQNGLVDRVEAVFHDNNVIGFNSYGEQYRGVHVNQTLTGIAIGEAADA